MKRKMIESEIKRKKKSEVPKALFYLILCHYSSLSTITLEKSSR